MWGATNPFIKRGSIGYNELKADSKLGQIWLEIKFLISRWQYVLPLILNQLGSVVYVITLQRTELSLTVPMANSLTFVFTAITAKLLGEQQSGWRLSHALSGKLELETTKYGRTSWYIPGHTLGPAKKQKFSPCFGVNGRMLLLLPTDGGRGKPTTIHCQFSGRLGKGQILLHLAALAHPPPAAAPGSGHE
ncbi:AGAP012180-PA-like protein [Anopheles sinensis]|uniref:AGAP012180-PA-like protein n=1 Tax=Anopheles sinensis TaxID=74873 RepID=A0A084WUK7_ANOSI|nr:AGAP012180-PA-like protein [Anopheles sinensis]